MPKKFTSCIFITVIVSLMYLIIQLWLVRIHNEDVLFLEDHPIVLWWTSFVGDQNRIKTCGTVQCYFTEDRTVSSHPNLRGILFYGTNFNTNDLPLPRHQDVHWGLLHEESPRNNPMLLSAEALALFNHSATFSRYSDVPLTLVDLTSEEDLLGSKYFISVTEKSRLIKEEGLAPVLYIHSDCNTATNRDAYVKELMKYIPIDSYGTCLNNKEMPEKLKIDYISHLYDEEFLSFVAQYKFSLAFENAVCEDYITEKLWRPLIVGSVPIYYGSPSFKDWLPNTQSAISARDFESPKMLANYLLALSDDDTLYNRHLAHKNEKRLTNRRLQNAFDERPANTPNEFGNYVEQLECLVCERLHEKTDRSYVVTKKHYDCPVPVSPLTNQVDKSNWWVDQWAQGECKAKLLSRHLNSSIDEKEFNYHFWEVYLSNNC